MHTNGPQKNSTGTFLPSQPLRLLPNVQPATADEKQITFAICIAETEMNSPSLNFCLRKHHPSGFVCKPKMQCKRVGLGEMSVDPDIPKKLSIGGSWGTNSLISQRDY